MTTPSAARLRWLAVASVVVVLLQLVAVIVVFEAPSLASSIVHTRALPGGFQRLGLTAATGMVAALRWWDCIASASLHRVWSAGDGDAPDYHAPTSGDGASAARVASSTVLASSTGHTTATVVGVAPAMTHAAANTSHHKPVVTGANAGGQSRLRGTSASERDRLFQLAVREAPLCQCACLTCHACATLVCSGRELLVHVDHPCRGSAAASCRPRRKCWATSAAAGLEKEPSPACRQLLLLALRRRVQLRCLAC